MTSDVLLAHVIRSDLGYYLEQLEPAGKVGVRKSKFFCECVRVRLYIVSLRLFDISGYRLSFW